MKIIALSVLGLLLSVNSCPQERSSLAGRWVSEGSGRKVMVFGQDGTLLITQDAQNAEKTTLPPVKYESITRNDTTIILMTVVRDGVTLGTKEMKYKIEGDRLFLPKEVERNGVIEIRDYVDIYVRADSAVHR